MHCWVGDDHLYFTHNQNCWKCVYYRVGLYGRTIFNGSLMGHGSRQVWAQANHHNWRWISVRLTNFLFQLRFLPAFGQIDWFVHPCLLHRFVRNIFFKGNLVLLNSSAIDISQGRLVGIQDRIRYGIWIQYKLLVCSVDAFPSWEFQWHACNSQGDSHILWVDGVMFFYFLVMGFQSNEKLYSFFVCLFLCRHMQPRSAARHTKHSVYP